jgi:hypothetical protein
MISALHAAGTARLHCPTHCLADFLGYSLRLVLGLSWAWVLLPQILWGWDEPKFTIQELDRELAIGYAVIACDIDGDADLDLVVADQLQIVWYRNPGQRGEPWKKFVILDGQTQPDNVSIAAIDIVGDGNPELVVGAGWKPFNTTIPGQLVWLKRGDDVTKPWSMHELPCEEPTVHRVKCLDLDGDGRMEIVHVPLMGSGSTSQNNWVDGRPLQIIAMKIPDNAADTAAWRPFVISRELHVAHNFCSGFEGGFARPGQSLLIASYEGISLVYPEGTGDDWTTRLIHAGDQRNPASNRGASEIDRSTDERGLIATIEPWHGNQVVVYSPGKPDPEQAFTYVRTVIDNELRWGHGIRFADLDRDGRQELVVGVRDDPNPNSGDTFTTRRGLRIYQQSDSGEWQRSLVDSGNVAIEDLCVADLDGDGRLDIVAVGRQTRNARIYWNLGPSQ